MRKRYHSALCPPEDAPPQLRFECPLGVALVHDIRHGIPEEMRACDVIYCEPPWPRGYDTFNSRAGVKDAPSFAEFAALLDRIAWDAAVPVVYVIGRSFLKYFAPQSVADVRHNGWTALAVAYRLDLPNASDSESLLTWLADLYACVGDFVAGYGRTGRYFAARGKRFVLSDFNPQCIGHIAQHAREWFS